MDFINEIKVLNVNLWPIAVSFSITYGGNEVTELSKRYYLNERIVLFYSTVEFFKKPSEKEMKCEFKIYFRLIKCILL